MKTNYLEEFIKLQNEVKSNVGSLAPKELYFELTNWASGLKKSHQARSRNLYSTYLSYFEDLEVENYTFDPLWYDFEELVNCDFLKHRPMKLERMVDIVENVLWEIIAFKSDRRCKRLVEDDLRVLTDKNRQIIIFYCDGCGYAENIGGNEVKISEILYPATKTQILDLNILPSKVW